MPITFGSVGDIISVCQLAKELIEALDKSKGSAVEYQALKRDLELLNEALLKVDSTFQTNTTNPELVALHQTGRRIADACAQSIRTFKTRVSKYDRSLRDSGSNRLTSAFAKLRWQVGEKEDLVRFRVEVAGHLASLNMLLNTANWTASQDNKGILKGQDLALSKIDMLTKENNKLLADAKAISGSILQGVDFLKQLTSQITSALSKILFINVATYKAVLSLQSSLPSQLERLLIDDPFILEDAIGRQSPVHLQFITSWDALDAVLETRFRGIQGYEKICKREYILQERATGFEISRDRNWEGAFCSGQRVDMSLIFQQEFQTHQPALSEATCPKCQCSSRQPTDCDIHCSGCGMWFRRITEINEVDPEPSEALPKPWQTTPIFGVTSLVKFAGPEPPPKKRKFDADNMSEFTSFKRIRLISKHKRTRRSNHFFSGENVVARMDHAISAEHTERPWLRTKPILDPSQLSKQVEHPSSSDESSRVLSMSDDLVYKADNRVDESGPHTDQSGLSSASLNSILTKYFRIRSSVAGGEGGNDKAVVNDSEDETEKHDSGEMELPKPINTTLRNISMERVRVGKIREDDSRGRYCLADFELFRTIGTGSFAKVRLAKSKTNNKFYALKIFSKQKQVDQKVVQDVNEEAVIQHTVFHKFMAHSWDSFQDRKHLYMVMDFIPGGELWSLLRSSERFPDPVAKFYAAEVILALDFLHSHQFIYGDIKPENILLDRHGHIKLTDFTFAKRVGSSGTANGIIGTKDYIAPEILTEPWSYTYSLDWWGLGILIYEMLCGYAPFQQAESAHEQIQAVLYQRIAYPAWIHPDARTVMHHLLIRDPERRLGAGVNGTLAIISQDWFKEVEWERLVRADIDAPYVSPIKKEPGDTSMFAEYSDSEDEDEDTEQNEESSDIYDDLFPNF